MSAQPHLDGVQAVFPGAAQRRRTAAGDPLRADRYRRVSLFPLVPRKVVDIDHSLVDVFRHCASFLKILCYLQGCAEAVTSVPFSCTRRKVIVHSLTVVVRKKQRQEQQQEEGTTTTTPAPSSVAVPVDAAWVNAVGAAAPWPRGAETRIAPTVAFLLSEFFPFLNALVDSTPLEDMSQQRFGNRAKREFHRQLEAVIDDWMARLVATLPPHWGRDMAPYSYDCATNAYATLNATVEERTAAQQRRLAAELAEYVKDSFGNATRLDYGTGHELHFFIVLMTLLEELGDRGGTLLTDPDELATRNFVPNPIPGPPPVSESSPPSSPNDGAALLRVTELRRQMVFYVFQEYLAFSRRLQKHYSLEPAGSHGSWGLDDYHHIPYILGAAQLIGMEETTTAAPGEHNSQQQCYGHGSIITKFVCEKPRVRALADEFMYFGMIEWIAENKSGPFHEHSNMLYNISAVERWAKTYGGMVKMFAAEVLSKFNVIQHMLFGVHLPWNTARIDVRPTPTDMSGEDAKADERDGGDGKQNKKSEEAGYFL